MHKEYKVRPLMPGLLGGICVVLGVFGIIYERDSNYYVVALMLLIFGVYYFFRMITRSIVLDEQGITIKMPGNTELIPWNLIIAVYSEKNMNGLRTKVRYADNRDVRKRLLADNIKDIQNPEVASTQMIRLPEKLYEDYRGLVAEIVDHIDGKVFLDEFTATMARERMYKDGRSFKRD